MNVIVNGSIRQIDEGISLQNFVELNNLPCNSVVIELNQEIISLDRWPNIKIQSDDKLEIIRFVGGG